MVTIDRAVQVAKAAALDLGMSAEFDPVTRVDLSSGVYEVWVRPLKGHQELLVLVDAETGSVLHEVRR